MNELIVPLINNLEFLVSKGGYAVLAFATFVEGLPMIGTAVPGQTMVVISGFLAHAGYFTPAYVIALVTVTALLGDVCGYLLGKKVGSKFITALKRYFFVTDDHIAKAEASIRKHSGWAIIFARYNPVTRSLIPFFAGITNVPSRMFWPYDIIGAVIWSSVMVTAGYLFGASYKAVAAYIGSAIATSITISVLIIWGYRFVKTRRDIFSAYHAFAVGLASISIIIFGFIVQDAFSSHTYLARADAFIALQNSLFAQMGGMWAVVISSAQIVTHIASPAVFSIGVLCLALYQLFKLRFQRVFFIIMTMGGGLLVNTLFKILIERDRPFNASVMLSDYSFPSGHAMAGTLFAGIIIVLYTSKFKTWWGRDVFVASAVIGAMFVGLLRVIINVHWLSDVIGALMLGVCWISLMYILTRIISTSSSWKS